jgi:hypothetical protein
MKFSFSQTLSTYGKSVREFAREAAATSNSPYGRVNETLCATPTIGFLILLHKQGERDREGRFV